MRPSSFVIEISGLGKMFNKLDTSCQDESEFVNHFMATSKSGTSWILAGWGALQPFKAAEKGMNNAGSTYRR
jgi:hypothetical protein